MGSPTRISMVTAPPAQIVSPPDEWKSPKHLPRPRIAVTLKSPYPQGGLDILCQGQRSLGKWGRNVLLGPLGYPCTREWELEFLFYQEEEDTQNASSFESVMTLLPRLGSG